MEIFSRVLSNSLHKTVLLTMCLDLRVHLPQVVKVVFIIGLLVRSQYLSSLPPSLLSDKLASVEMISGFFSTTLLIRFG